MRLKEYLKCLNETSRGLLAINFYNAETLKAIIGAASIKRMPIILQLTKTSIDYLGIKVAVNMARGALVESGVQGWLHLDHGGSVDLVKRCLDEGFDSVMIDYSERPISENISITKEVVRLAESYNACVEAELGYIAKLGQSDKKKGFTSANEAKMFFDETGVDSLAVAIGSAHGFYREAPKLNLELLKEIKSKTGMPLVLHGGSGIPSEVLKTCVMLGVCKINLATEVKDTFMRHLKFVLSKSDDIDLRKTFPYAIKAVEELVLEKMVIFED